MTARPTNRTDDSSSKMENKRQIGEAHSVNLMGGTWYRVERAGLK